MHHWVLRGAFCGLALWLLFAAWAQSELGAGAPVAAGERGERRVLLLYDERSPRGELEAAMAANLAGRFGRARFRSFGRYRSGDTAAFDAAIVIGSLEPPAAMAEELRGGRRPVLWIGPGLAPPAEVDWVAVRYRGRDFPRDLRAEAAAALLPVDGATVLAGGVGRDGGEMPWAVRTGHWIHVADSPFAFAHEDDRYLVFADLLFELLAPDVTERHRAMVRIDAVGPDSNPRRLRGLADLLAEEGVPFSIAVYDSYRDPDGVWSNGRPIALSLAQRPQLVSALRYAISRGATLVAHGHTHQTDLRRNPRDRVSGGEFEFFTADLVAGAFALRGPLPRNAEAYWRDRFQSSARHWRRAGLDRPLLFAAPHDAASAEAYRAARPFFPARYERSLYFAGEIGRGRPDYARGWTSQFFPYEVVDMRGDFVLPENLGSLSTEAGGRGPERLIASAARNLAVRDGFASFSMPWHESPEALRTAVRGIERLGYRFVSPEEVVRRAPAHAAPALHRASPVAEAAGGWARSLPPLEAPMLVALLALVASMWLGAETLLKRVPARPPRAFAFAQRAA